MLSLPVCAAAGRARWVQCSRRAVVLSESEMLDLKKANPLVRIVHERFLHHRNVQNHPATQSDEISIIFTEEDSETAIEVGQTKQPIPVSLIKLNSSYNSWKSSPLIFFHYFN